MKPDVFSTRACSMDPNCQVDMEGVELLNQIVVFGLAGAAGLTITVMVVVYVILAVRKAVAKGRRLLGMA